MKSKVAKGCVTFILIYAGTALLYFFVLQYFSSSPDNFISALFGSFFGLLFFGAIRSVLVLGLEEKTIRKYQGHSVFEDGKYVAAIGPVHPVGEPLTSPLKKRKCISYEYDIYRRVIDSSEDSHKESDFTGFARIPGVVRTNAGDVKLLEYMDLSRFPEHDLEYDEVHENAIEYFSRTHFEDLKSGFRAGLSEAGNIFEEVKNMPRSDRWNPAAELEREHYITERCVEVGQEVCALGIYSSDAGALVSEPGSDEYTCQLIPGNAKQALSLLKRKKYLLFLAVLAAFLISHGIIYYVVGGYNQ
jgi:hypothetical protein